MIIFLHGTDEFLVLRRKQVLVRAFVKKYAQAERFEFDFEEQGSAPDVRHALDVCEGSLFATEKMIVFLHPFVLTEVAEKLMTKFLKERVALLPEHTILLFVSGGKIKKTHPLTKVLLDKMDKEEVYDVLDGRALRSLVLKELSLFNDQVQFTEEALTLFLTFTGSDTARQLMELEKLATFRGAGMIGVEDVRALVAPSEERDIFNALDVLGRGEREKALLLFRKEAELAGGVFSVLAMCAWQVRRLLLVREVFDRGIRRPSDVVGATDLPPFTVQKSLAVIGNFPLPRLKRGLTLLSDIDTALKQGKADPEVSLDLFIWKF